MSQQLRHSRRAAHQPPPVRYAASFVAACLVLLQLVTTLHFALVPHGFSAGLNGFVHVHSALHDSRIGAVRDLNASSHSASSSWVRGSATCAPESCPVGFAGAHSLLFAASMCGALLAMVTVVQLAPAARFALSRSRILLSAPKTSPPALPLARCLV